MANLLSTTVNGQLNTGNVIDLGYTVNGSIATTAFRGINFHSFSDGNYLIGKRAGAWTQPLDITFYTGIKYHAHRAYGGHKFYTGGFDSDFAFSIGDGDNLVRVADRIIVNGTMNVNYDQVWTSSGNLHLQYSSSGNIDMNYGGGYTFSRTSLRAPIFYDYNDTNYYVDPNSNSYLSTLRVADASSGVSLHVGVGSTHGVYTADNNRKYLVVSGDYYPHMAIVARYANNTNHGAVFSFVGTEGGTARQWNLGISNQNPFLFSIGYNRTGDNNPHYGVGDGWSADDNNHARLSIDRDGNTKIRGMLYVNGTSGGISTGNAVIHAGNIGSQSVSYATTSGTANIANYFGGFTAYGLVEEARGVHSFSDFVNGTLVTTDINASEWAGDSFVMEVSGKSYGSGTPFKLAMEGYLYADTIINVAAMSYGSYFPSPVKVMNLEGNLAFWWPRGSYWNSFEVHVRAAGGESWNRVTGISDSADPASATKKVSVTPVQVIHTNNIGSQSVNYAASAGTSTTSTHLSGRTDSEWYNVVWGAGNPSYMYSADSVRIRSSDGALRANIYYANQNTGYYLDPNSVSNIVTLYASTLYGSDVYTNGGWFRNHSNNNGIYWSNTGWHLMPENTADFRFHSGSNSDSAIRMETNGTTRGYVYANSSNEIGFLNNGRSWRLRVYSGGAVESYGDFRAPIFYDSQDTGYYLDPNGLSRIERLQVVSNWGGTTPNDGQINIRGQYPSMTFRNTVSNNMWLRHMDGSGDIQHYFAPSGVDATDWSIKHSMRTDGTFQSNGSMRAPIFYDSNDTTYYLDPNNTLKSLNIAGNIDLIARSAGWAEGIRVRVPSTSTWGGIRFTRDRGNDDGNWAIGFTGIDSTDDLTFWGNTAGNGAMRMRIDQGANLSVYGSVYSPIYYDINNTGYYGDFASTSVMNAIRLGTSTNNGTISGGGDWGIRFANDNGWIQFGPANNSWTHIYSNRTFYFNQEIYINDVQVVKNSGTWGINVTGSAGSVAWSNVSSKPATWLNEPNLIQGSEPDTIRTSGFFESYLGSGNPTGTWMNYINVRHSNTNNGHGFQIGMSYYDNNLWFRSYSGNIPPSFQSWSRALGTNTDPYPSNMNQYVRTTDDVTHNSTTSPTFLVNNHSDNTKGYRIHNTSGSSVSAMFTNSSNQLVIAAGAVDQINLNKKVYVNGVALGVNVAPSATAGRIDASNDIVAYSSSDERLKYNIAPIENALDKVKSLTGVEFDWKPEYKHAHGYEGHDTGIIAQQVEAVMPSAVRTNDTGFLAVRYEKLIGLLIEANKELAARVEELEKKLS